VPTDSRSPDLPSRSFPEAVVRDQLRSGRLEAGSRCGAQPTEVIESTLDGSIIISVRVIPRAARSGLAGTRGGALLVRLHAPPVDGSANAELVDVIATALDVPKRAVSIVAGERSRQKRVRVSGVDAATATSRLVERAG